jgi:hypothetical protein
MKIVARLATCIAFALGLGACQAAVGTGGMYSVPKDASSTCAMRCTEIGLPLDSVVIMANNVGCVCRARSATAEAGPSGASAGMAAILVQEAEQQQAQQMMMAHH